MNDPPEHFFSIGDNLPPRKNLDIWKCLEAFLTRGLADATDIQWIETRDAAKHPIMHRMAPTAENDPDSNIKSVNIEKHSSRAWFLDLLNLLSPFPKGGLIDSQVSLSFSKAKAGCCFQAVKGVESGLAGSFEWVPKR